MKAERGAFCFTLSHFVLRISLAVVLLSCAFWVVCLGFWFVFCFGLLFSCSGEFLPLISFHLRKIPVVDRPRLVLDRQCRKKKSETICKANSEPHEAL